MTQKNTKKHAVCIGSVTTVTYLVGYYMRKLLSVTAPALLAENRMTESDIGLLSFAYMLMYAIGQLINGRLGDRIHPRWMILLGLSVPGLTQMLVPLMPHQALRVLCFAVLGFFLAMLRGPLVKVISENAAPQYARLCCVGLSTVTYLGPLVASLLSILFPWQGVFIVGGAIGIVMGVAMWLMLTLLDRFGIIAFRRSAVVQGKHSYRALFRLDRFVMFMVLSALFEISCSAVDVWITTYFVQRLQFSEVTAGLLYSGISVLGAVCPFLCLLMFRLLRESDTRLLQITLLFSTAMYVMMFFVTQPVVNSVLFFLAIVGTSISSAVLWSIYIPGLGKSGQVSTANGVLDFSGYIGAAIAGLVVSNVIRMFDISFAVFVWGAVPFIGFVIVTLGGRRKVPVVHH